LHYCLIFIKVYGVEAPHTCIAEESKINSFTASAKYLYGELRVVKLEIDIYALLSTYIKFVMLNII